jgi:hypothetical protein
VVILGILDLISIRDRTKISATKFQHFVANQFAEICPTRTIPGMPTRTVFERVAFSPGEFAELFGKSQTWGYRQIYAGKVEAITEHGRILIPAAEVDKILATAGRYEGLKVKAPKSKEDFRQLKPELRDAWKAFLEKRRKAEISANGLKGNGTQVAARLPGSEGSRKAALDRLRQKS